MSITKLPAKKPLDLIAERIADHFWLAFEDDGILDMIQELVGDQHPELLAKLGEGGSNEVENNERIMDKLSEHEREVNLLVLRRALALILSDHQAWGE